MPDRVIEILVDRLSSLFNKDVSDIAQVLKLLNEHERLELFRKFDDLNDAEAWTKLQNDTELKIETINSLLLILINKPNLNKGEKREKRKPITDLYHLSFELYCSTFDSISENNLFKIETLVLLVLTGISGDRTSEVAIWIEDYIEQISQIPCEDRIQELKFKLYNLILRLFGKLQNDIQIQELDKAYSDAESILADIQQEELNKDIINVEYGFLIGVFANLIQVINHVKTYLLNGASSEQDNIYSLIRTYAYNAEVLSSNIDDERLGNIVKHSKNSMDQLCHNSIWSVANQSPLIQKFFENNIRSKKNMILTFLPSQRNSILEVLSAKKSIVVNMPTSSGKSLLAELYILFTIQNQSYDDFRPTISYIVPTNALINQVKSKLRSVFKDFNYRIESVLPFYELDSIEEEILLQYDHIDVLVTTPEKMDFLVRNDNPIIRNLKLVILDEAHNISDESRGAKFELLLSILKQKRSDVNYLLLSPFIENSNSIAEWLGDTEQNSAAIAIDWSPTKQYIGCNYINSSKTSSDISYFPTARNNIVDEEIRIPLNVNPQYIKGKIGADRIDSAVKNITLLDRYISLGDTTLVLCRGAESSQKLAGTALKYFKDKQKLKDISNNPDIQNALTIIKYESQENDPLIDCLKYGVAYHHSRLNGVIKEEIEKLAATGIIKLLFATTTLAQGMNFPITTVIFDTLKLGGGGNTRDMDITTFRNIAGRAGRAYMDKEGHVIIGYKNSNRKTKELTLSYIKKDLEKIISSLSEFFKSIDGYIEFNYQLVKDYPAISNFLQYLNHIVKVAHKYNLDNIDTNRIRTILNTSLFYKEGEFEQGFIETQRKINDFSLSYVNYLKGENKKQLRLADLFGVSNISLNVVTASIIEHKENIESIYPETDQADHLLASKIVLENKETESLAEIIDIIAKFPEMQISIWKKTGKLDSESIAKVIIGWVNGQSISNIASQIRKEGETESFVHGICNQYINSSLKNFIPWGINIYQVLTKDDRTEDAKMLPSYIYYGVKDKEAVILSKIGVPRFLVHSIKGALKKQFSHQEITPSNIEEVRQKITQLKDYEFGDSSKEKANLKNIVLSHI